MTVELATVCLFGLLFSLLALGVPVSFALGGAAAVGAFVLVGPQGLAIISSEILHTMLSETLIAIPLFVLMANVLQHSGIADDLYQTMYSWAGPLRGGLAMGTVLICTVFAAMSGVSGAATVTMGLIALPSMLKRNYDKSIVLGSVAAGGVLGIIIPPSCIMIWYAMIARESVGGMFFGGVIPGLLIAVMHIIYIGIRSALQPHLGPPIPPEERVNLRKKVVSLRSVILPLALIILVLGVIYSGAATATEAAGIGALGAFICAAIYRRLNWHIIGGIAASTLRLTGMIMWIGSTAFAFNGVLVFAGSQKLICQIIMALPLNPWLILIAMQVSLFILGMFLNDYAIIVLFAPIFVPIIVALGFDPLWFGILFILNMQMAYLSPPFGTNLFYLRGLVPKGITMGDIYRSCLPFVGIQALGLILVMIFPKIALWLPSLIIG